MTVTRKGVRLYPVCKWYDNQHKLYNYNDKMYNKAHDEGTQEAFEAFYESERLLDVFHGNIINGIVYATYKDYCKLKDIIGYYDITH